MKLVSELIFVPKKIHWGFKYQTRPVSEWWKQVEMLNCPAFGHHSKTCLKVWFSKNFEFKSSFQKPFKNELNKHFLNGRAI